MRETVKPDSDARSVRADEEFHLGLAFLKKKQWKTAARHFRAADTGCPRGDPRARLYRSYHGLALVSSGDVSGLNLCRHAAGSPTGHAEVFLNLALAEIRLNHRRRACEAVAVGLHLDPRQSRLLRLRARLGVRRKPCVPFLNRNNPLNKWLGRITYRVPRRRHGSR